jgi:hypothetical protein
MKGKPIHRDFGGLVSNMLAENAVFKTYACFGRQN